LVLAKSHHIGIAIKGGVAELVTHLIEFNKVANNPSTREFLKSPTVVICFGAHLCKATVLAH
jgi:hypothetical protein